MKDRIRSYFYSSPILSAISCALFAVALFSVPSVFSFGESVGFALEIVCRALVVFLAVVFAKICGFKLFAKSRIGLLRIFILFLGLLVCINNFPIIGLISGKVTFNSDAKIVRYVLYCAAIAVAEEFVFRGLIMPLTGLGVREKPHAPFLTVLISSSVFALCHLFNIFSAGVAPTLLQVGYTFLTGGLFGAAYLITENLIFPILLHFVFDIGGLMFSTPFGIASGNMWDTVTVIITAVLGIIATTVYVVYLFNYSLTDKTAIRNNLYSLFQKSGWEKER